LVTGWWVPRPNLRFERWVAAREGRGRGEGEEGASGHGASCVEPAAAAGGSARRLRSLATRTRRDAAIVALGRWRAALPPGHQPRQAAAGAGCAAFEPLG
jgi:hypothetical protein